jgi:hypothetical protein
MTFQHRFTNIIKWYCIELPNPDILVSTARCQFFIVSAPSDAFYLVYVTL